MSNRYKREVYSLDQRPDGTWSWFVTGYEPQFLSDKNGNGIYCCYRERLGSDKILLYTDEFHGAKTQLGMKRKLNKLFRERFPYNLDGNDSYLEWFDPWY